MRSLVGSVQNGAQLSALRARVIRKAAENGGKLLSVELSEARARAHCKGFAGAVHCSDKLRSGLRLRTLTTFFDFDF